MHSAKFYSHFYNLLGEFSDSVGITVGRKKGSYVPFIQPYMDLDFCKFYKVLVSRSEIFLEME